MQKMIVARLLLSSILGVSLCTGVFAAEKQSPKETYLAYHAALLKADKMEMIAPFMSKKVRDEMQNTEPKMKDLMWGMIKQMAPKMVQVTGEKIEKDRAVVSVIKPQEPVAANAPKPSETEDTTGNIDLVMEDGAWKIEKESWKTKIESSGPAPAAEGTAEKGKEASDEAKPGSSEPGAAGQ